MRGKRPPVLILYNVPREFQRDGKTSVVESDASVLEEIKEVTGALSRLRIPYRVCGVTNLTDIPAVLASSSEKVVFNLVEGFHVRPADMNYVPAICEAFGKAATGSDTACLTLAFNKWQAKCVLSGRGVPVPRGVLVFPGDKVPRSKLPRGPYIVKPVLSDASEGIDTHSVIPTAGVRLDRAVRRIHRQFRHPALVEQLVGRREINVSILKAGDRVRVLPLAEIDFTTFGEERPRIVDYAAKWLIDSFEYQNTPIVIPAKLSKDVARRLRKCALKAWLVTGCRDYARVDVRLSDRGEPYVLEVNANPDISQTAGFAGALSAAGISYDTFIETLVHNALDRLPGKRRESRSAADPCAPGAASIRQTIQRDREPIRQFLEVTGFFRTDEIIVALEVLDDALKGGPEGPYQSFTLECDGEVAGWVCFGPTPCTVGTYDIYWIAVSPRHQARGFGTMLLLHAEELIRHRGGRISVIETSSREIYHPTRQFYLKKGYTESARIKDFYAPGDDEIVYTKLLS